MVEVNEVLKKLSDENVSIRTEAVHSISKWEVTHATQVLSARLPLEQEPKVRKEIVLAISACVKDRNRIPKDVLEASEKVLKKISATDDCSWVREIASDKLEEMNGICCIISDSSSCDSASSTIATKTPSVPIQQQQTQQQTPKKQIIRRQALMDSFFSPQKTTTTKTSPTEQQEEPPQKKQKQQQQQQQESTTLPSLNERFSQVTPSPDVFVDIDIDMDSNSNQTQQSTSTPSFAPTTSPANSTNVSSFSTRNLHPFKYAPATRPASKPKSTDSPTVFSGSSATKKPKKPKMENPLDSNIRLSNDQQKVIDAALKGESFFFTGAAGTGKSLALRRIVKELEKVKSEGSVFVTASTGVAACNIGGCTLHSFAGIGLGTEPAPILAKKVIQQSKARQRWIEAEVLIIDEISMISAELFDKLDFIAKRVRKTDAPFGGLQVILCGDFFQLPPVFKSSNNNNNNNTQKMVDTKLCFESAAWSNVVKHCYQLQTVFRQRDQLFVSLLNEVRNGNISEGSWKILDGCRGQDWTDDGIEPTKLYPHRDVVDRINNERLNALVGKEQFFEADDSANSENYKKLLDASQVPAKLILKVGAQVILLKNLDFERDLVNGSQGIVIGFEEAEKELCPIVKFRNGITRTMTREEYPIEVGGFQVAVRKQIPLNLAWALSIHKSQGMTLTKVEMSLEHVFAEGQAYVALSRVTSLQSLKIVGKLPKKSMFAPNQKVVVFYSKLESL